MSTVVVVTATLVMTITGYTECDPGMRCDGITASGMPVQEGICACGNQFAFGTLFYLPRLGASFVCMDRGDGIGDRDLDLYFNDRPQALRFGVRHLLAEARWWVVVPWRGTRGRGLRNGFYLAE